MAAFNIGAEAYIVANGLKVRPVRIISQNGGLYTLRFLDGDGATRLKKERLYRTKEDAESSIRREQPEAMGYRSPHSYGYL